MADTREALLKDGLATLATMLPPGYALARSSLGPRNASGERWIVLSGPAKKGVTCLVLARRRVEPRDLGAIAGLAARTNNPSLLVSTFLPEIVRAKLRGFGIGYWDLAGNARIALAGIDLCLERDGGASVRGKGSRPSRSLCGEMAGRVARVLVDVRPPHPLAALAALAHVDTSCISRTVALLTDTGIVERQPRAGIVKVDWQTLLARWSLDAPGPTRGESFRYVSARGVPDFLDHLARSGFLHALTGRSAFAALAAAPVPKVATLYVDDVPAAMAQFALHPAGDEANVVLIKPLDHSVFQRSWEKDGLRQVSPSLMVADLDGGDDVETVMAWLAKHESRWRQPAEARTAGKTGR